MIAMVLTREQALALDALVEGEVKRLREKLEYTKDAFERQILSAEMSKNRNLLKQISRAIERGDLE